MTKGVFFLNTPYFFGIKFLKISSELPILPEKKVHKKWWWWLKTANKYDKIQNSSEVNYVPQIYYFYFFLKNLLNDFSLSTFLYHNRYSVLISRSTKFKTFFLNDPKVRGVLFEKKKFLLLRTKHKVVTSSIMKNCHLFYHENVQK